MVMMRITAGTAKGHKLITPKFKGVRPTTEMVKEALFNVLAPYITEATFLDLFAGIGNVGLEALSRGAKKVYFVDNNPKCIRLIKENAIALKFSDNAGIILMDALESIEFFKRKRVDFDIIFMDPPYELDYVSRVVHAVITSNILKEEGILVVQRSKREILTLNNSEGYIYKEKSYGDTILDFVRRSDN